MPDRFSFEFDSYVWNNLRSLIKRQGTSSLWYRGLKSILSILEERASRLNWLYRQFWLETSDTLGLSLWGVRYGMDKRPGESDDSYRNRLLLAKLFKMAEPTVATKRQILQYATGLSSDQISYLKIYSSEEGKNGFFMGGPTSLRMISRKYILHRYRFLFPKLPDSFDRNGLRNAMDNVNVGGNVPELWEDQGTFDPFVMGGTLTGKFHTRRAERVCEYSIF